MRFNRVTFGNAASPFLLNATLKFHLSQFDSTTTTRELKANLYVDDWLTGADSEEEVCKMMTEAGNVMQQGGFTLTKWATNCRAAKEKFTRTFEVFGDINTVKVSGLSWTTEEDSFIFRAFPSLEPGLFTKRLLLSITARLFDPLGFLTPFSITLKILFQEAWKRGFGWDDVLPIEFQERVNSWIGGLGCIQDWKIPRCISPVAWNGTSEKQLIAFSDASEKAYGCCVYLKTLVDDKVFVTLVTTRTKVAPLKKITLPRLELLAALLAARLLTFVASALQIDDTNLSYTCWSDSQITLSWIKSDATKWKQFIRNRMQEIQQHTNPERWKFCPGKENPADLLTRGVTAQELTQSDLWLHGPTWLKEDEARPDEVNEKIVWPEMDEEERQEGTVLINANLDCRGLIDYDRFSDIGKLVRVMTWILRFIRNSRAGQTRNKSNKFTPEELETGKTTLLRCVQKQHFGEELTTLDREMAVKKTSHIYKLSPFIDKDGLLRIQGRLTLAPTLLYDEKHPILLPKCHVSYLMMKNRHVLMKHAGVNTLITSFRNSFWILSVRTLAKKICKLCFDCQRQDARPCEQAIAPLPEDRVKKAPPFSVVGIDHAGPLYCSDNPDKKLYIVLFTCAVIRAVHVELVDSISLEDFILAFRRFAARRGQPSIIYSDNAKTFRAAHGLLKRELEYVGMEWKFSAPLGPWWGGWWERLIRSVKSALRKSLGKTQVSRVKLETVLQEIEACINSRPLTYVGDTGNPLTPSHLLIGRSSALSFVMVDEYCEEMSDLALRERCQSQAVNQFWNIWQDSYIRNLPPMAQKKPNNDVKIGSLVLIREEGKPRLQWALGVVTKTFVGKDGLIRAVELKTTRGKVTRALQKLHKLELFDTERQADGPISSPEATYSRDSARPRATSSDNQPGSVYTRAGRKAKPPEKLDL